MRTRQPLLALGAVLGLGAAAQRFARRSLPKPGIERVAGLDGEIEILRDRWGVPHVYARSEHDLFFANGVVHAEDRLMQMELHRRAATGRLSEMFGALTLEADRFMRRVGFHRVATEEMGLLDAETRAMMDAYVAGINWVIEARPRPPEFVLLGHRPPPWRIEDSIAWSKLMAWGIAANWGTELSRARIAAAVGPELAALIDPPYPAAGPAIVGGLAGLPDDESLLAGYRQIVEITGLEGLGGSNAWAIRPERAVGGAAILANDMHLAPQMPTYWYGLSLDASDARGEGLRLVGASLPGLPGIVVGHNYRIAWGITASLADVQDLFLERRHPDNPRRYARDAGWEDARVVVEEIRVRRRAGWVSEEVHLTSNGPIITAPDSASTPLALRDSTLEPSRTLRAGRLLNHAASWQEFRTALAEWTAPSISIVYADREGNIGYQCTGAVPRRGAGDGTLPAPGWDRAYAWQGYLSLDELPHAFNPPEGVIAAANNQPAPNGEGPFLGRDFCDGYRVGRILEMLRARERHDVQSCAAIQQDTHSNAARDFRQRVQAILGEELPIDPLERAALQSFYAWDFNVSKESPAASIYEAFRAHVLLFLYGYPLGDVRDIYLGRAVGAFSGSSLLWRSSSKLIAALDDPEWPEKVGHRGLRWREVLLIGLGEGVSELRRTLGEEIGAWEWGRLHRIRFEHPLARGKVLAKLLNRGERPIGGDIDTPLQTGVVPWRLRGAVGVIPTYRQIVDFGNLDSSVMANPLGQSGHPASRNYDNLLDDWLAGRYQPMTGDRARVEEQIVEETRLLPTDEMWPRP